MDDTQNINLDELIREVDTFHRQEERETLVAITRENLLLQREIHQLQQKYDNMIVLIDITKDVLQTLEKAILALKDNRLVAEKEWLAFRGIQVQGATYSRMGFI